LRWLTLNVPNPTSLAAPLQRVRDRIEHPVDRPRSVTFRETGAIRHQCNEIVLVHVISPSSMRTAEPFLRTAASREV
jgi:hypothetical protein